MLKQKGNTLLGILIGVLIAGGLFAAYYFGTQKNNTASNLNPSQTPNVTNTTASPTSVPNNNADNWQAYKGDKYSFKYPSTWIQSSPDPYGGVSFKSDVAFYEGFDGGPYSVFVHFIENHNHLDFKNLIKTSSGLDDNIMSLFKYEEGMSNGVKTYSTSTLPSAYGAYSTFFEDKNGNLVEVGFVPYSTASPFLDQDSQFKIYQQILQTFKFN